jgi:hypothetical protein
MVFCCCPVILFVVCLPRPGRSCASLRPRHTVLPVHKVEGLEDDMGSAVSEGSLQLIAQLAGGSQ